jgi:hypothetical protein
MEIYERKKGEKGEKGKKGERGKRGKGSFGSHRRRYKPRGSFDLSTGRGK